MCERSKRYDLVLHQKLESTFRKRRLTSSQIKELVRAPDGTPSRDSIMNLILDQGHIFDRLVSRNKFKNLSLLWIAVLGRYYKSAKLLVRSGADVDELCGLDLLYLNEKSTVLQVLLRMKPFSKNEQLIRLVMDHDADLQARDSKGKTALHYAVTEGRRVPLIKMLLEKGADVNVADDDGETPLLAAAGSSKAMVLVPLLMERGADVLAKDIYGHNILHYLPEASGLKQATDLARVLIEKGVSLDDRDHLTQFQPLHQAIVWENNKLVKLYLDHGADVNARTVNGHFPLYLAAKSHRGPTILKTLLEHGADVQQRTTSEGRTALHKACRSFGDEKRIRLLLSAGANVLVEDGNGKTPFALMNLGNMENSSLMLILKTLALRKASEPSIEMKDERIIEQHSKLRDYYRDCLEQLEKAKSTRLIESCTFLELLAKSQCQIALLMRNPEFEINFKNYDLSEFSMYTEDILVAFERAQRRHKSMLQQEDVINKAVYGILPYLVVSRVVHYICNSCEKKFFY